MKKEIEMSGQWEQVSKDHHWQSDCYKQLGKKKKSCRGKRDEERDKDMEEHALFSSSKPIAAW